MTENQKREQETRNELPFRMRCPTPRRFGGLRTQNTFGAASSCYVFTDEERRAWADDNRTLRQRATSRSQPRTGLDMRRELYHWLKQYPWEIAATLTFANDRSERQALAAAKRFWKEIDYHLYGNASVRFGKRCERIMILEGDGVGQRLHHHGAIMLPKDRYVSADDFCDLMYRKWCKINQGPVKVTFRDCWSTDGWCKYISKRVAKTHCDSLDVHSSHINPAHNLLNATLVADVDA